MDIQTLKVNLSRVFDDKLKTKQWHNILDYVIIGLIVVYISAVKKQNRGI